MAVANITDDSNEEWKALIEDSVDTCVKRIDESETELQQAYLDHYSIVPYECNVKFVATISCIYYQIFINCPESAWEDSK